MRLCQCSVYESTLKCPVILDLSCEKLHISPGYKTSGQQQAQRSLKWGSCEGAQQSDWFLQHESCSGDVGAAGHGGSSVSRPSVSRPSWHGLGQRLPAGLQLPVSPWRGPCGHQELLQRGGGLGPPVVVWVPAHTWEYGGAQRLLVGRHQPRWNGVVGLLAYVSTCCLLYLTFIAAGRAHLFRV